MKKMLIVGMSVAVLIGTMQMGNPVMAMPDQLVSPSPATAPVASEVVLVPVASQATQAAVHDFGKAWEFAYTQIAQAKERQQAGEKLTAVEKKWLDSEKKHKYGELFAQHLNERVHFYKKAHNWNAMNKEAQDYNYMTLPGGSDEAGYTNSYGFNVLNDMAKKLDEVIAPYGTAEKAPVAADIEADVLAVMSEAQASVANDELRSYMNETVWFAAKQTVKEKKAEEPSEKDMHKVDLRAAINGEQQK